MTSTRRRVAPTLLALALLLTAPACGGDDDDGDASADAPASEPSGEAGADGATDVDEALAAQVPEGTVEVPSEDGATTIADFAAGGSDLAPSDPEGLAQILALVGTDADGYITDDAVVIRGTEADATLWCATAERLDVGYDVIPVLPDGTGVDCSA